MSLFKVLVMSALEGRAPWPARRMRMMAWSIVPYCNQKLWLGMRLLKLRTCEPWGEKDDEMEGCMSLGILEGLQRRGWEGKKSRNEGMFDLAPTSGAVEAACGWGRQGTMMLGVDGGSGRIERTRKRRRYKVCVWLMEAVTAKKA